MGETLCGMRPEAQLSPKHSLALQPSPLSDKQVVMVPLQWLFVHIENFRSQVQAQRTVRPFDESRVGFFDQFALFVDDLSPPYGVFYFQLQPGSAFFVQSFFFVNFILVGLLIEGPRLNGEEIGQFDEMDISA